MCDGYGTVCGSYGWLCVVVIYMVLKHVLVRTACVREVSCMQRQNIVMGAYGGCWRGRGDL